nr:FAD-dependent monooxygenase [Nocardia fusca]
MIGAGSAGTAAAILLAEAGVSVELVEAKPDIAALGSGITLQGNALRVLRQLGVWDPVRRCGCRDSPHGSIPRCGPPPVSTGSKAAPISAAT